MQTAAAGQPKILTLTPVAHLHPMQGDAATIAKQLEVGLHGRVIMDIVGICQAKCPYCAQNSGKNRRQEKPQAYMAVDLFRGVIEHLSKSAAFKARKVDRIYLYNWGEPFLAPAFNQYLEILREHGLFAVISSNFQKVPVVRQDLLPVINEVLFSTSGMTQETYGKIHGGDIAKVLDKFEHFLADLKTHAPGSKVFMSWHRYRFNEHEFWKAYAYCRKVGIGFIPSTAFLNDLTELVQVASDRLPADRKADAQRDLFFDHMANSIAQYANPKGDYDCPAWDDVVIDEQGRVLLCCGTDSQTAVGTAFDLDLDQMLQKKKASGFCKACIKTGVAEWAHNNHHDRNQMPWPSGGGLDRVRLKWQYNRHKVKNDVRNMLLNHVAFGEEIIGMYRKLRYS